MSAFLPDYHPYNGGYAIPKYVLNEPSRRGAIRTPYRPRRSIDLPKPVPPWRTGYAIPEYIKKEMYGSEVHRTKYTPRRTIGVHPSALGDVTVSGPTGKNDPIAEFGKKTADYIVKNVYKLPVKDRSIALSALFAELEPGLAERVRAAQLKAEQAGMKEKDALRAAIALETSRGFVKQIVKVGRAGRLEKRSVPHLAVNKAVADQVVLQGAAQTLGGIGDVFKSVGGWLGDAGKAIGKFGCQAMQNPLGQASAAAAAGAYGGQSGAAAGMAGAQIIGAACAKPQGGPMGPVAPPPRRFPVGPVLAGVGALALVLLVSK